MISGQSCLATSLSKKFDLTACQSVFTARKTMTASRTTYRSSWVSFFRVVRLTARPPADRSLRREVLLVELVVGAVIAELLELLVDGVLQPGVPLLDREAVLLT